MSNKILIADDASSHVSTLRSLLHQSLEDVQGCVEQLQDSLDAAREVLLGRRLVCEETVQGTDGPIHLRSDRAAWLHEADSAPEGLEPFASEEVSDLTCPAPFRDLPSRVFLIHGRNLGCKECVARYLEKLGAEVFVLQELPNEGSTVIEKLQRYANVHYAVALLTGDDQGGLRRRLQSPKSMLRRPRQNVLFELGYFLGHLGRRRVCILRDPDIEIPSDMQGVLTIALDSKDAWRRSLAKELQAAGLPLDFSKVL